MCRGREGLSDLSNFMEKNNGVLIGAGFIVTVLVVGVLSFQAGKNEGIALGTPESGNENASHASMSMDQMTQALRGLTGDDFDKAFVEMMIAHHQGAVDMAVLIPAQGKHDELKQLGEEIVTAQTKEIMMMKQWLKDWGYEGQGKTMNHQMQH